MSYQATVELHHRIQKGDHVPETVPAAIPSEVTYLYPGRYCESDKLVRLAQHEFGKLQHGFSRVTAICNWSTTMWSTCEEAPIHSLPPTTRRPSVQVLSRFRASRHSILPSAFDPGKICGWLCVRSATVGFPRVLRSLSGRSLVYLRFDTTGPSDRSDSHRYGSRRR